jgi:hypothetical protein
VSCPFRHSGKAIFPECSSSPSATLGEDWLPRVPDFWHSGKCVALGKVCFSRSDPTLSSPSSMFYHVSSTSGHSGKCVALGKVCFSCSDPTLSSPSSMFYHVSSTSSCPLIYSSIDRCMTRSNTWLAWVNLHGYEPYVGPHASYYFLRIPSTS